MIDLIESRLEELISPQKGTLFEAARYSLFSGGKRIRPLLVLHAAISFGLDPIQVLDPACALELIHTYSLIHDDLPCMDNDDFRRGKPTLHKAFSEPIALLTGDFFLTLCFEVLSKADHLSEKNKLLMIQRLSFLIGADGMIGGQVMDMEQKIDSLNESLLLAMHEKKTSKLFTAGLEFAAIASHLKEPSFQRIKKIGSLFGLIYQFQDDLLDTLDIERGKASAVTLFGSTLTQEKIKEMQRDLFALFDNLPCKNSSLFDFIKTLIGEECLNQS